MTQNTLYTMKTNLFCIKEQVIVLTGGYGILGAEMSKYLALQGAKIVILGRNQSKGEALVEEIIENGGDAFYTQADVLDKESLIQSREAILAKYKKIDVLINAAGGNMPGATIGPDETLFDMGTSDFNKVVDLNLMGTVLPTVVFAEAMVKEKVGNIINITSESAIRPLTRVAGYGAAKAAVSNFTQYMAGELALKFGENFRVNALAPGFFLTDQNRSLLTNPDGSYTDRANTILAHTPFKRFGKPEELLGAIHYLVSEASSFVTGEILVVDGGFNAFSI